MDKESGKCLPFPAMFSVICAWSSLAMFAGAINTSQTEHLHVPSAEPSQRRHVVPMQATVLAEGDTQVMRKENVSEIDARGCTCTDVDLKGKKWSPGGLKKCVGNCKKVSKTTEVNDCPKDWKIFSPRSKEDWQTIISLGVIKEVLKPYLVVDVTQDKNGCGGCGKPMNSEEDGQSMWKTLDGSAWWLRASSYGEPNGDYVANCFLGVTPPTDANAITFNDWNCGYHSHSYLCQPDDRYTTTTTEAKEAKSMATVFGPGVVFLGLLGSL